MEKEIDTHIDMMRHIVYRSATPVDLPTDTRYSYRCVTTVRAGRMLPRSKLRRVQRSSHIHSQRQLSTSHAVLALHPSSVLDAGCQHVVRSRAAGTSATRPRRSGERYDDREGCTLHGEPIYVIEYAHTRQKAEALQ